jgi:uncharacterized protein with von Willebrand factor type A (vWA) domain
MSEEEKPKVSDDTVQCSMIEREKAMAEIEERRDERRFKHKLLLIFAIPTAVASFVMVLGSLYGWLFLEKEFLEGPVGTFFEHIFDALKILAG